MNAVEIEEAISLLAGQPFVPAEFPYAFLEAFWLIFLPLNYPYNIIRSLHLFEAITKRTANPIQTGGF